MEAIVELRPLLPEEYENFIKRNKEAFLKAVIEEFGEENREAISTEDIKKSLYHPKAEAFNIIVNDEVVGGVVVRIDKETNLNSLDLMFVAPKEHSRGIGGFVWEMIEEQYPDTKVWETHTPYFETRNIHFYVNKCGFKIVEFYNPYHKEPEETDAPGGVMFFRFEKEMK